MNKRNLEKNIETFVRRVMKIDGGIYQQLIKREHSVEQSQTRGEFAYYVELGHGLISNGISKERILIIAAQESIFHAHYKSVKETAEISNALEKFGISSGLLALADMSSLLTQKPFQRRPRMESDSGV